ncbi:SH3 domain-containing protein [uncultured Thioclava sp.]|uniref:SH3 domain-containing protein n=1 Tax=Thioclava arctica TaxID=3238301 RepID=A0ABV3TNX8_9RHOB|nr:SH3 domain-containing protein [uncultured Thioclava sp.]
MGKLLLVTLAGLFVTLSVLGREMPDDGAKAQIGGDSEPQVTRTASTPDPLYAPDKIATQAPPQVVPVAAVVTPVIAKSRMPGPSLKPSPEYRTTEPPEVAGGSLWVVSAKSLNVRSGPSTSNSALDRIQRGEQVLVIAQRSGWAQIKIEGDGIEGWVAARFLTPAN